MAEPGRPLVGAVEEVASWHSAHFFPRAEVWGFYLSKFIQRDDLQRFHQGIILPQG